MLARRPLTLQELEQLAGLRPGMNAGRDFVTLCRSFLSLRGDTVYMIHQSAQEWLSSNHHRLRSGTFGDLNALLFENSIQGMTNILKKNLYDLPHYGVLADEVDIPDIDPLSPIRYSCQYWAYHMKESADTQKTDIFEFLQLHFIHWLEAMALMEVLGETIPMVDTIRSMKFVSEHSNFIIYEHLVLTIYQPRISSRVSEFLFDGKRFIQKNFQAVNLAPLQLYVSALICTPSGSLVRPTGSIPKLISKPPLVEQDWGCLLQTLENAGPIGSVVFSDNGKLLAAAAGSTAKI
ncbi:unnamed protein product [Penicillium salamii]|nr:unnamed protein product [Penicillium salamii]CAG8396761.1 unnamed protein product [Penicillium salamii]